MKLSEDQPISRRAFSAGMLACGTGAAFALASCSFGSGLAGSGSASTQEASILGSGSSTGEAPLGSGSNTADASQGRAWLLQDPQTQTLFVFDTTVEISAYCSEELMEQVVERCLFFENHFSRTVEDSDVWRINEAKGSPVEVAEETADIIAKSLEYCVKSGGLFDITIGSVSSLWDFNACTKPDDVDIQEAIKHIDYNGVTVEGTTVTLSDPQAKIDLGGTAKGYIADDLYRILKEGGCLSACLNLGGNVMVLGTKPDGSDWRVGVQDPNGSAGDVIAVVACADMSVVTSGLYERHFEINGVEYYHILDPKTGYPVVTDLVSSSVLCEKSLDGDAYATTMFLMGHNKALEFINDTAGLEGIVEDNKGNISQSEAEAFTLL